MSRPLRTVVILMVMGLVAVATLAIMAGRLRSRTAGAPRKTATREVVPPIPDPPAQK